MTSFMNILGWFGNWNRITSQETTALTNIHPAKNLYDEAMQLSEEGHNKFHKVSIFIRSFEDGWHDALFRLIDFHHKHRNVDELRTLLNNFSSNDIFRDPEFIFSVGKYLGNLDKDLYSDLIEHFYSNAVELDDYNKSEFVYELFKVKDKKYDILNDMCKKNKDEIKKLKLELNDQTLRFRECQKLFEKMRKLSTIFFKFLASAGLTRQVNDTCVSFQKFIPQKKCP